MALGSINMNLSASDVAAWVGAVTGTLDLAFNIYKDLKGKIKISLNSGNTSSYRLPGKYLTRKYYDLSFTNVVAMSVRITNTKNTPVKLNNVFIKSENNIVVKMSCPFEFTPIGYMTEDGKGSPVVMYPQLAPYSQLPFEIKAGESKDFQLVFAYEGKEKEPKFIFDFGPKNKIITLKIPSLVDDLRSQKCKLV